MPTHPSPAAFTKGPIAVSPFKNNVTRGFNLLVTDEGVADVPIAQVAKAEDAALFAAAARMYDALAPFAEFARVYLTTIAGTNPREGDIYSIERACGAASITVEHLIAARTALAHARGEG